MAAMNHMRGAVLSLSLCLSIAVLAAEDTPPSAPTLATPPTPADGPAFLFVESEPLGAKVFLDGKDLERPSPLLLRDLAPGMHRFRFEKEGWYTQEVVVALPRSEPLLVSLVRKSPLIFLDGAVSPAAGIGDARDTEPSSSAIRLSSSPLEFSAGRQGIDIAKVFPRQKLLDGVNFSLPLFLALTGVLTVREIYAPRSSTFIISPELAASALIGAGLLGWDIDLQIRRFRFTQQGPPRQESWKELSLAARLRFDRASETLRGGDFESALVQFQALVDEYPDDPIMPRALFETARLLSLQGDTRGAEAIFRKLVEDYPMPELYDRAIKNLADCLVALGDKEGARKQLDLLTYNGAGLSREEIELFRQSF
ncbi:MAG TPA: tetratricopeptide repeat protein [Rectinemataceae bacterium]|nr:tetratricopeptide repeat protein [Rectinemataceae bacterium]